MPTIADYKIVQDSAVTFPDSGDIDHDYLFSATGVNAGERSILVFRINPAGTSTMNVELNGQSVLTQTFNTDPQRPWHQIVAAGVLVSGNNTLTITWTAGPGSFTVSDIYFMHQTTI